MTTTLPECPTAFLSTKRVLLLDDDVDYCDVLQAAIEWHGHYHLTVAHRGVDAVREIQAHDFDAIICDMVMPGISGEMFYVAVQRLKPHLCTRFIFLTAHADDPAVARFFAVVGGRVLHKPLETDDLIAVLAEVTGADACGQTRTGRREAAASRN